jgi:hypothetical protein
MSARERGIGQSSRERSAYHREKHIAFYGRWAPPLPVATNQMPRRNERHSRYGRALWGVLAALATLAPAKLARAGKQHFEPTDLELEDPGTLDIDLQFGLVQGPLAPRLVLPDLEIDFGLAKNVEFDIDTAYGIENPTFGSHSQARAVLDNMWLSMKLGLWSTRDEATHSSWGIGVQAGPKIPLAPDAHGIGYEALLLVARNVGRVALVLNAGGLVDPGAEFGRQRPIGVELGLDFALALDEKGVWSIISDAGTVIYVTGDPHEIAFSAGVQYEPFADLDLSLVGIAGVPPGSDEYGVLLGVSPKLHLW